MNTYVNITKEFKATEFQEFEQYLAAMSLH